MKDIALVIMAAGIGSRYGAGIKQLQKVGQCGEINMSAATMISMVTAVMDYDLSQSYGFPFERNAINHPKKSDIVVPCTLETNVIELHKLLYGTEDYVPSETVQKFSDYIENDTGQHADDGMDDKFTLDYEVE